MTFRYLTNLLSGFFTFEACNMVMISFVSSLVWLSLTSSSNPYASLFAFVNNFLKYRTKNVTLILIFLIKLLIENHYYKVSDTLYKTIVFEWYSSRKAENASQVKKVLIDYVLQLMSNTSQKFNAYWLFINNLGDFWTCCCITATILFKIRSPRSYCS